MLSHSADVGSAAPQALRGDTQGQIGNAGGPFVPKPSTGAGYQRCGMSDLGSTVRRCPLASTAVGGDCYSLGYSVARESVSRAVANRDDGSQTWT
jgi:hypothetical protein